MSRKLKYSYLKFKLFLRNKLLGPYAKGVVYDTKNGLILAPIDDFMVGKKLGFKGEYNIAEVNAITEFVKPTDSLYIVGVHWGTLLIPLSKRCKKIIGYEANPKTFYFLEKNLLVNKIDNVFLFNNAAGDANKKMSFYTSTINSGGSKIKPKIDKYIYKYDNPETIEVDMVAIDEHVQEQKLPKADGIIMDIEGAEYFALKGMSNLLKASRFLYIEYVPHHLENVSGTSNEEFFNLILPHYNSVKFMSDKTKNFDISVDRKGFLTFVDSLSKLGKSDDLLFVK